MANMMHVPVLGIVENYSYFRCPDCGKRHSLFGQSHLPQIAAMADDHYVIEKSAMEQRTITEIYHLSDDASVGEIARLLGGVEITDAVMQNAREMKNLAQSKK